MNNEILIIKADRTETKILIDKMIEKCKWLNDNGISTWDISRLSESKLQKQYIDPKYFVCYRENEMIGGFILITQDNFFWPEVKEDDTFFIHKLLVCNGFNGNGYGKNILNWIKEYGEKNGKKYLRLDYFKSKKKLMQFYEENGFYKVDEIKYLDTDINIKAEYIIKT
jgi:GNAT superfamily N-acetyltransferase